MTEFPNIDWGLSLKGNETEILEILHKYSLLRDEVIRKRANRPTDYHPSKEGLARKNHEQMLKRLAKDICGICNKVLGFPVHLQKSIMNCRCRYVACLQCLRDALQLNEFRILTVENCKKCGTIAQLSVFTINSMDLSDVYRKDYELAKELDEKYGKILCPRGCGMKYFRIDTDSHIKECEYTIKNCTLGCGAKRVKMVEHKLVCRNMKINCKWCGELKTAKEQEYCKYKIVKCEICYNDYYWSETNSFDCKQCTDIHGLKS